MRKKTISLWYTFLFITFPLIGSYDLVGITPFLLICVIDMVLAFLWMSTGNTLVCDRRGFIYLAYMLPSAIYGIIHTENTSMYSVLIRGFLYVLIFFVFYNFSWQIIDFNFAIKIYTLISVVLTVLIIIQFVLSLSGRGISFVPPGLNVSGANISTDFIRYTQQTANRYSTIFLEPAHQVQYVLPCIAILIFNAQEKRHSNLYLALFLTIGILCTTSSLGIFGVAIVWMFYFAIYIKTEGKNRLYSLLFLVPVVIVLFYFFMRYDNIRINVLNRIASLDFRNKTRTEGYRRIRYGWECYSQFDIVHKLFGCGYKHFGYYIKNMGIGLKLVGSDDLEYISYSNGFTGMLCGLGVIGFVLNLRLFFWDAMKSKEYLVYGLVLVWGIIMATSNSFDEMSGLLPMVLIMNVVFKPKVSNKRKYVLRLRRAFKI